MKKEKLIERLWIFQITIKDELMLHKYPNFQIKVATKTEMKDMIKNFHKAGLHIKINACRKMTNADWLYLDHYMKWWNDTNLITPVQ